VRDRVRAKLASYFRVSEQDGTPSRIRHQPTDTQADRGDLWLGQDGGKLPQDAIQGQGAKPVCRLHHRCGLQPDEDVSASARVTRRRLSPRHQGSNRGTASNLLQRTGSTPPIGVSRERNRRTGGHNNIRRRSRPVNQHPARDVISSARPGRCQATAHSEMTGRGANNRFCIKAAIRGTGAARRSPRNLLKHRHPARGLGWRRIGQLKVDAPVLFQTRMLAVLTPSARQIS